MEEEKKITDYIKSFTDTEHSIKRIPFYMLIVCVLLVVLIFEIRDTNKSLRIIAENGTKSVEYETIDDTFVEIVTEETKELVDYIPAASENTSSTTKISSNKDHNNVSTTKTSSNSTTKESTANATGSANAEVANNNQGKRNYILVTSTKKVHSPDCTYALRAKAENKKSVTLTDEQIDEYINRGYVLCKSCGGK